MNNKELNVTPRERLSLGKKITRVAAAAGFLSLGFGTGKTTEVMAAPKPIVSQAIIAELPRTTTPIVMPLRKDSIEVVFSGTQQQVNAALHDIGYQTADKFDIANKARAIAAACASHAPGNEYATAPNPEELLGTTHPEGSYFSPDKGPSQQTLAPRKMVLDWPTNYNKIQVAVADDILQQKCLKPFDPNSDIDGQRNKLMKKLTEAGYNTMLEGNKLTKNKRKVKLANGSVAFTDNQVAVIDVTHHK